MPKYRHLIIFAVVLVLLFGGLYLFKTTQVKEVAFENELVAESPTKSTRSFGYECERGKTAFAILEEKSDVSFSESSFGKLVTAINGTSQNDGKYWLYSIDGKEATVGASTYECQGAEQILWELK